MLGHLDYHSLCRASEVCRSWRVLALDPCFWTFFNPVAHERFTLPPLVYSPSASPSSSSSPPPPFPASPSPSSSSSSSSSSLSIISPFPSSSLAWDLGSLLRLPRFSQLHSIDLSPWKDYVDDQWIVDNLSHLKHLRDLSLVDCKSVKFIHPDLANLVGLTSINLGTSQMGQLISNSSIEILKCLTNLRKINLHYCEKVCYTSSS